MSERFINLYRLPGVFVMQGCPAVIEAGALLKDSATGKLIGQLKINSLSEEVIKSVRVHFTAFDINGKPIAGPDDFYYDGVNAKAGTAFGSQSPVYFPNEETRAFSATINAVVFENGTIWNNESNRPMYEFPAPEPIEKLFETDEMCKQYRKETNANARYIPVSYAEFWRCACGKVNTGTKCLDCKLQKSVLETATDPVYIAEVIEKKKAKEKEAADERFRIAKEKDDADYLNSVNVLDSSKDISELETAKRRYDSLIDTVYEGRPVHRDDTKQKEYETKIAGLKKRKKNKRIRLAVITAALIALGLFGYYVGYPFFLRKTAESAVTNHNYDAAIANYMKLKDDAKITETNYEKANYLLEQKQFDDAAALFESLGDYKDSSNMKRQSGYLKGKDLIENKKYHEAIAAFKGLENYEDTGKLIAQAKYEQALLDIGSGEYKEAVDFLNDAKGYVDDAKTKLPEVQYVYGKELMGNGKFEDALKYLNPLKTSDTYEDIKQLVDECNYKAGLASITARNYPTAIRHFEQVKDTASYPELSSKINEAKYLYVSSHKKDSDSTTYNYLKDLRQIGYKDSSTIYSDLYAWRAEHVVANTSENNTSTDSSSISKYSSIYFHFNLAGGPPNGKANTLSASVTYSDGSKTLYGSWTDAYPGSNYWYQVWWENPSYANNVNVTFHLYADGVLIAQKTVYWGS